MVNHWWRAGLRFGIIYRIPVIISWRLFRISKSESISSKKGKPAWKWPGVFFHPAEIQCLQNLAGDAQDELFFRYWSVKESFLKYTGSGLSSPLSGFEVRFDGHRPRIFQSENLRNLSISACPVDPAYKCFVCAETTEEPGIFPFLVPDLFLPDE